MSYCPNRKEMDRTSQDQEVSLPRMSDPLADERRSRFPHRLTRIALTVLVVPTVGLLVVFRHAWFTENFGEIDPGRAYRVAQPFGNLPDLITSRKLASVLNLRGGSIADSWYVDEVRATDTFGVDLYDLPMSATRRPKRRELLGLIDVINHCRYPLLIHCKSGADRTGLASALYLMLKKSERPRDALRAFSVEYGHFPIGGAQRLHEPINEYEAWLTREGLDHTPERFENWVKYQFESDDPFQSRPSIHPGPRMERQTARRDPMAVGPKL